MSYEETKQVTSRVEFTGENIRLISDIIKQNEKEEGAILFLDFAKAFDSLE